MQKLKEKTYTFLTTISIPGVPGIFTSSNIFFSIFWTLLLLALFGVGLWNIALAIMDFYNYDVISNIKRVSPENVTFPAITICTKDYSRYQRRFSNNTIEYLFLSDKSLDFFVRAAEFTT